MKLLIEESLLRVKGEEEKEALRDLGGWVPASGYT